MSDAQLELELFETQEKDTQWNLEDLTHFWMSDGLPVFIAEYDDICDIIESMQFSIYYLLGNVEKTITPPPSSNSGSVTYNNNYKTATIAPAPVKQKNMQLFRIVNNIVGRTVTPVNNPFDDSIASIDEEAIYNMPAIPHILIDKLDQFFRLVDAQHGTESIVMLTYDLNKEGPDGWGILVPDQTNTSVHCNYDPDSIAQIKPDNVMIVGSVHSHPGMSAYASGTDHKDQADFDGVHITFGWQKSVNNGATQYYIEMQMAGKAYKLDPEDVFEDMILHKAPDPDVVEWTGKVKKVLPPSTVGGTALVPQIHNGPALLDSTQTGTPKPFIRPNYYNTFENVPKFQVEDNALIVAEVDVQQNLTTYCPSCESLIDDYDVFYNYCEYCMFPLTEKNTPVNKILEDLKYFCKRFNYDTDVPVYLWGSDSDKNHFLIKITPTTLSDYVHTDYDETYESTFHDRPNDNWKPQGFVVNDFVVDSDDILDFEAATKQIHVFEKNTKCSGCEFYYDSNCPFYREQILKYLQDRSQDINIFDKTITGKFCNYFVPYSDNSNFHEYGNMYD